MQRAGVLFLTWWVLCSLLLAGVAAAQTEPVEENPTPAEEQYPQADEGCANPQPVETFSGSENQQTAPFDITGESFRILFETEADPDAILPTVEVDVLENGEPMARGSWSLTERTVARISSPGRARLAWR